MSVESQISFAFDDYFLKGRKNGISNDSDSIFKEFLSRNFQAAISTPLSYISNLKIRKILIKLLMVASIILGRSISYKVSHTISWNSQFWGISARGRKLTVVRIHDLFPIKYPNFYKYKSRRLFKNGLRTFKNRMEIGVANSHCTKNDLIAYGVKNQIEVLYCSGQINRENACEKCQICLNEDLFPKRYVLAIGTIEPRKNYLELIKQWSKQMPSSVQLVICGNPGWLKNYNNRIFETIKTSTNIQIMLGICNHQLIRLIQKSSLVISASIEEGFNIPAIEARRLNSKVLLSDIPIHREIHSDLDVWLQIDCTNLCESISQIETMKKDDFDNLNFVYNFDEIRNAQLSVVLEQINAV